MRTRIGVWVAILAVCAVAGALPAAPGDEPSIQVVFLRERDGKPPLKHVTLRLTLVNRQDVPVWFVLPYWGDKRLSKQGVFLNEDPTLMPFGGGRYEGQGGPATRLDMIVREGFKAFRLPAKGRLVLDGYDVACWKKVSEMVVVEARELKVNGKTPLEKWLPYETTSGKDVRVSAATLGAGGRNLDWDAKRFRKRDDYRKEVVASVKAEGVRSWTVRWGE